VKYKSKFMFKPKLILLFSALFLLLGCASQQAVPKSAVSVFNASEWPSFPKSVQRAEQLWASGQFNEALKELDGVAEAEAELLLGELYYEKGMFPESMTHFTRFLREAPEHPFALLATMRLMNIALNSSYSLDYDALKQVEVNRLSDEALSFYPIVEHLAYEKALEFVPTRLEPLAHSIPMTKFRWLGPFSVHVFPDFDAKLPPEEDARLADSYLFRGLELKTRDTTIDENPSIPYVKMGSHFFESYLNLEEDGEFILSMVSSNLFRVYVGESLVLDKGVENLGGSKMMAARLSLPKGTHRVRIKILVEKQQRQAFTMFLSPRNKDLSELAYSIESDATMTSAGPKSVKQIDILEKFPEDPRALAEHPFYAWLYAFYAISISRHYDAGLALKASIEKKKHIPSSLLLVERYGSDPHILASLSNDFALDSAQAVIDEAPEASLAMIYLIKLLNQIAAPQASDAFARYDELLPANADTQLLRYHFSKAMSWKNEMYIAIRDAYKANPSCEIAALYYEQEFLRAKVQAIHELPDNIQHCPQIISLYTKSIDVPTKNIDNITASFDSLRSRYSASDIVAEYLPSFLRLGKADLGESLLEKYYDAEMVKSQQSHHLNQIIDFSMANNSPNYLKHLQKFLDASPTDMALRNIEAVLKNESPLQSLRKDGLQIVRDYLASNPKDRYSAFYILDYAAYRYFEDGSALSVTHQISRILNKEGKNLLGEVYLPPNAVVTQIRTIKHDTLDTISPEAISHKESISMPKLDDGDFIEVEYFLADPPRREYDNAYYVPTWFFKTTDAPLLHSEFIVEYPKEHKPITEFRNAIPNVDCKIVGENKRCSYRMDFQLPPTYEPYSPSEVNLLPNMQIAHRLDFNDFALNLYNRVLLSSAKSAYLEEALRSIFAENAIKAKDGKTLEAALAIFNAIKAKITEKGQYFSTFASQTWNAKTGNRLGLLKALLDLAEIKNDVVVILSYDAPVKIGELLPPQLLYPSIRCEIEGKEYYLDPSENFTPFAYLAEELHDRPAYILSDGQATEIRTPRYDLSKYTSNIFLQLSINEDGSLAASGRESLRGARAMKLRNAIFELKNDSERLWRILENSLANSYGLAKISRLDYQNLEATEEAFSLEYDFSAPNYAEMSEVGFSILPGTMAHNLISNLASLQTRENPLIFSDSLYSTRSVVFRAPSQYHFSSEPQNIELETPFGSFTRTLKVRKNELSIEEKTIIPPQRVEVEDYAKFREFLRQIDDAQSVPITAIKKQ